MVTLGSPEKYRLFGRNCVPIVISHCLSQFTDCSLRTSKLRDTPINEKLFLNSIFAIYFFVFFYASTQELIAYEFLEDFK